MAFDKDLKVNIIGDASKLTNAMGKAGSQVDKFAEKIGKIGKTMTVVGGAVTAAFGAIIMKTTQLGDTYDKMSKRTNISVEALSALGYAAKISGADLDTVEKSLRYLARGMNDASQGIGEAKEAFEELNISVTDTKGNLRPTMDVLKEAATKLAKMTDETKQVALATDIFGARYGTQLLPMLKEGGAGIEALMNKAKELGIVMSTEAASKAAEFNDRLTDLKESIGGMGRSIGEILIPPLIKFSEKAIKIIKEIKAWADAHKPLVEMIVKVGATLGVMAAVGGPILMAVSAFMKMKGAIVAIGTITSGPIGIVIAAVAGLAIAWTTNFGGIRDFTIAVWDKIKETFGFIWDKIKWMVDKVKWLGEKLGIYKEKTKEVTEANQELTKAIDEVTAATGEAATAADTFTTANNTLVDSLGGVAEKAKEAGEAIKLYAEDVGENYIALSVAATESWDAFYKFWEAEAKRTADEVTESIEEVANKMYKVLNAKGQIIGFQSQNILSQQQVAEGVHLEEYGKGTPYVPETGLALLHKGEAVIPANQNNNYKNSYSPTINITIEGDADESKVRRIIEKALEESTRQFNRTGNVLIPGMA